MGGMDGLSYSLAMEEISRGCAGTGTIMTAHNSIFMGPIKAFANEKQKAEILPQYVTGEKVGCFMLSEPGNGSDAGAASTNAKTKDDKWVLNGTKAWITNSYQSSGGSLFATTDSKMKNGYLMELKHGSRTAISLVVDLCLQQQIER